MLVYYWYLLSLPYFSFQTCYLTMSSLDRNSGSKDQGDFCVLGFMEINGNTERKYLPVYVENCQYHD